MCHDVLRTQLNLLVPSELPLELELSQANQIKLTKALTELLQSLAKSDRDIGECDRLRIFPHPHQTVTKISLALELFKVNLNQHPSKNYATKHRPS